MPDVTVNILNTDNSMTSLNAPTDIGLNLMEFLKANEYDIQATCGGIARCAKCHVCVIKGFETLGDITTDEYAILDRLTHVTETSRLSCQISLAELTDGFTMKLMGDGLINDY